MFSLRTLLLAVVVAAVFIVAFPNSSPIWSCVVVTLTLLLLVAALVGIYLFPDKRPFLVCAVIAGVVYGAAALIEPLGIQDSLITTRLHFEFWYDPRVSVIPPDARDLGKETIYQLLFERSVTTTFLPVGSAREFHSFNRIGHCAVALILAVIAGLVGSYVARRRVHHVGSNNVQS
jgi:hypothetical protein